MNDSIQIDCVRGGDVWMDGGAMFGVVPKPLWRRRYDCDERNRIRLANNCALIRTAGLRILVDAGYGSKAPPKVRENHRLEAGAPLLDSLAALGVKAEQIDVVVLTHLHFDHAGGATYFAADGTLQPTFPNARHLVQRAEWEDAAAQLPELAGAYFRKDFLPLQQFGLVDFVDDDADPAPGVRLRRVGGHTRGMQLVEIAAGRDRVLFLADLCPTSKHLQTFWTMAYDQFLLDVRRTKPAVLGAAADAGTIVIFEHDPLTAAARLRRDEKEGFAVAEPVSFPIQLGDVL